MCVSTAARCIDDHAPLTTVCVSDPSDRRSLSLFGRRGDIDVKQTVCAVLRPSVELCPFGRPVA